MTSVPANGRTMLLEGKVAVVTGAASGIGEATARLFVDEGATVVLADVENTRGQVLAEELGERASFRYCDVTSEASVEALIDDVVARYGVLDCAVNNAGISGAASSIETMSLEDWNSVLAINLTGVFLCLKHELRQMRVQQAGSIVNISSGAGLIATPNMAAYGASKHGVLGLTKTAAAENAACNIRVNAVLPGSTRTPMLEASMSTSEEVEKMVISSLPGGRLGKAEEIAEAIAWLCSDRASYVSGESMSVDFASVCR